MRIHNQLYGCANHLLGKGSRPFRQSKDVKKDKIAIMAITISMAIVATMIITDIGAITASTGLRANCIQYNY